MRIAARFLILQALWSLPVVALAWIILAATGSETLDAVQLVRWTARAITIAAFPAGIFLARAVMERRAFRATLPPLAIASLVSGLVVFVLLAFVTALLGDARTLPQLVQDINASTASWETRNDAAWKLYLTFGEAAHTVLLAAIGIQVGMWAKYSLPAVLQGVLYWTTGLGLLVSKYAIFDTTYEAIVIRTPGDVAFAALYTLLVPLGICAGLGLPTLALLRGAGIGGTAR